ncbi:MAG TPA: prenyltransferase [Thermodesulfobacteriota bacterium]|nr:prenyltransferase [Thermodesulfobacteriota bacterium]
MLKPLSISLRKARAKLPFWLKIARLQFYPMALTAYSVGSACAFISSPGFNFSVYVVGYIVLFFVEFSTILANEYYDYEADRHNRNFSLFTGGTRVLVDGGLRRHEVKIGIFLGLLLVTGFACLLVRIEKGVSPLLTFILIALGVFLGLGYTVPPLKFSYRGVGEVVVGATHSTYLILCGYTFQTGTWSHPLPWLLSVPLFFSVLAANTLAGLPDRLSDMVVSKKSFAVTFGPKKAVAMAACFAGVAALSASWIWFYHARGWTLGVEMATVLFHGVILLLALFKLMRSNDLDKRIDRIMALSLSYIIWFGLIPIIAMLWIKNLS